MSVVDTAPARNGFPQLTGAEPSPRLHPGATHSPDNKPRHDAPNSGDHSDPSCVARRWPWNTRSRGAQDHPRRETQRRALLLGVAAAGHRRIDPGQLSTCVAHSPTRNADLGRRCRNRNSRNPFRRHALRSPPHQNPPSRRADGRGRDRTCRHARAHHRRSSVRLYYVLLLALDVQTSLTLVTHPMGGMAALAYLCRPTSQRPIDPSGLVLVAAAARKLSQRGLGRLLSTPATAALSHIAADTPEQILHSLVTPLCVTLAPIRDHLPAATIAATALTALTTTATSTAIGYLPSLRSCDLYPTLPAIRARTFIVSGGVDPLTPPLHAHELAATITNAVHLHVPTAGHTLPQQAPDVVNHAIEHATGLAPKPKNASASRISRSTVRPNPPRAARRQPPVGAHFPASGERYPRGKETG